MFVMTWRPGSAHRPRQGGRGQDLRAWHPGHHEHGQRRRIPLQTGPETRELSCGVDTYLRVCSVCLALAPGCLVLVLSRISGLSDLFSVSVGWVLCVRGWP